MTSALQAIVFDFDGVIADSEPLHLRAFQQTLQEQGLELSTRDYYTHYLGYDDVGLFEALARDRAVSMSDGQVTSLVARKATALQELLRDERRPLSWRGGVHPRRGSGRCRLPSPRGR